MGSLDEESLLTEVCECTSSSTERSSRAVAQD